MKLNKEEGWFTRKVQSGACTTLLYDFGITY